MTQWEGKSKGTPLGYKIFIFFIKNIGLNAAYFILYFVAAYFIVFSFSTTKTSYYFFRKRLKQSVSLALINVYRNYFVFGQTLIDRMAISFGLKDKFTFTHDGREKIRPFLEKGEGGIIFSGHIGSFNIARYFFDEFSNLDIKVNMVVTDQEHDQIKEFVGAVSSNTYMKFIVLKEDMSHIFEMNAALSNNEILIFAADRYVEGIQSLEHNFFGEKVKFPLGPYKLAARRKKPILFMFIMKGKGKRYDLYALKPVLEELPVQPAHIVSEYCKSMEMMVRKYPLQWFNFYDYWDDFSKDS
ncbi:lipid A biosynthesis acyltransferase [Aquimarina addita]|uniref:Lipid A biosynthesis acyltransferase n=1 Tax=Aquimarina addita TaxID=870485 RepID=A0ABP6UKH6_9FLAO